MKNENLFNSTVNFYNINNENFIEFLSKFYGDILDIKSNDDIHKKLINELFLLYNEFNEKDETVNINNLVTLNMDTQDKNCTKSNKNISLTFRTNNANITTGTIIGNIDTSIRPKSNIVVPCVGLNGAGNSIQAYGQARLKTNGDIEVTLSSSCSFLAICFSYNI